MEKLKNVFYAAAIVLGIMTATQAQNVGINSTGSDPHSSAILDLSATDKGLLIPNVALTGTTDATSIASPAVSLLVYNTATVNDVTPGYYYNSGSSASPVWTRLLTSAIDGSETKITAGTNISVTGTGTTANPYVVNATVGSPLAIGQSYLGGIIFWLDATGQHGLIASTADQSGGVQWYMGTYIVTHAVKDGVGSGMFNTERITAKHGPGSYAAAFCANYTGGNYGDWYLPSKYELNLLIAQKDIIGGFAEFYYWSSTETGSGYAWAQWAPSGEQESINKNSSFKVRAIRAF